MIRCQCCGKLWLARHRGGCGDQNLTAYPGGHRVWLSQTLIGSALCPYRPLWMSRSTRSVVSIGGHMGLWMRYCGSRDRYASVSIGIFRWLQPCFTRYDYDQGWWLHFGPLAVEWHR